ncbi:helix-turn-helix transcriptional regulator [Limosilactobacillus portuensis]|jgi:putative transcriptional regulator|uniref:Helix-turn-helix transcriptional regulator n=1 Tax=Limosilactobacillus portuensis TaxID=2742601 RepID=A0ABS6ISS7_9LACO|nr:MULTISPECIES: helix-turn-helix transcriptional regulator [Limosilactobacillus]MBU9694583.1 helix-turn-helix transcriptional regulator [Limosilactobacillus portuensis]MDU1504816.1 helix-turn-helix transcriptional regulator [Limosilactobacillus vaginalis]PMC26757.1 XRE family transcriptional regulator [Gardnerella vaginalis]
MKKAEFSYKKLWKLLIDRGMKKKDLIELSGVSAASIAKLGRNGNVTTEVLLKICIALNCEINEIMEIVED